MANIDKKTSAKENGLLTRDVTNESSERQDDEQIELADRSQEKLAPSRGQKIKRHCARWWWLHLLIFCVIFLIVALCLVYVAMPVIAQNGVNDSYLVFSELTFLNPRANGLELRQTGLLHSPSIFTPTLDAFNATLSAVIDGVEGSTFTNIQMPSIHALHPTSSFDVRNNVTFTNTTALNAFVVAMLSQQTVVSRLVGRTNLHEGALPVTSIKYDTKPSFLGLNALDGLNVTDARINFTATTGANFKANAFIPNPSVITVALGNVSLSLSTQAEGVIGNATILDMTLVPGNNSFPMTAAINQTLVLKSAINGMVNLSIIGTDSVYNGVQLPYYKHALSLQPLKIEMNITQIVADSLAAATGS